MNSYNSFIDNFAIKNVVFEGNNHIAVPVVLLTEGVHHGSAGAKYYPANEKIGRGRVGKECRSRWSPYH